MCMKVENLIIGAGISGITVAHKIATELNQKVLIIDSKNHIGGNCFDYYNKAGICVHQYGTHIFHTNDKQVWDFLSQFTKWYPYIHKVKALIDGQETPIPFNLTSIRQHFPPATADRLEKKLMEKFGYNVKVPILELRKTNDEDLTFLADFVYEKVFLHYTLKQWGMRPEDLDPSVTGRVPVYVSKDDRYFQDTYQAIPMQGYTKMFEKMLKHPNIKLKLNTKFQDIKNKITYDRLFVTSPIDQFFDYEFSKLPYRSLKFDFVTLDMPYFQSNSVINYPNNYDYTRIGEYKYFLNDQSKKTTISFEYPVPYKEGENEPYYPIIKEENQALYNKYLSKAKTLKNTYFLGRLGDYKYYDMDKAVKRALEVFQGIKDVA